MIENLFLGRIKELKCSKQIKILVIHSLLEKVCMKVVKSELQIACQLPTRKRHIRFSIRSGLPLREIKTNNYPTLQYSCRSFLHARVMSRIRMNLCSSVQDALYIRTHYQEPSLIESSSFLFTKVEIHRCVIQTVTQNQT